MLTISVIFLLASIIAIVVSAMGKCPHWVGDLLLWVVVAINVLPVK